MKKNLVRNRWSEQSLAEEKERKANKKELARKQAPPGSKRHQALAQEALRDARPARRPVPPRPGTNAPLRREKPRVGPQSAARLKAPQPSRTKPKSRRTGFHPVDALVTALRSTDLMLINITVLLLAIGLVMVFSASSYTALMADRSSFYYVQRQFIFALIGLAGMVFVIGVNPNFIRRISIPLLVFFTVLVVVAAIVGEAANGSQRWISLGFISFMPADFVKPLAVIALASHLSDAPDVLKNWRGYLGTLIVVSLVTGTIVIEDLGTGISLFAGLFALMIVAGAPKNYVGLTIAAGLGAFAAAVISKPYRLQRIMSFLHSGEDSVNDAGGYQLQQSLYAFGDGGLFGAGLGNGGQKMSHLFASHTDFIYSVIGEELGLIGALAVLALFVAFAWRGVWLALHIQEDYPSYVVFGMTSLIILQALINMGVAVGVLPVTGITLPLISYGGTSLVVTLGMVGIILNHARFASTSPRRKS